VEHPVSIFVKSDILKDLDIPLYVLKVIRVRYLSHIVCVSDGKSAQHDVNESGLMKVFAYDVLI
jgi:hypothetical protein